MYISQTFAKKWGPPLQKGAIFQNAFSDQKSLGTQSSYIWWYPEGLGVPETHLFACYSSKCKLLHFVCKLQHRFIILDSEWLFTTTGLLNWFYGRYILPEQFRIIYAVLIYIIRDMSHRNVNNDHSLRNIPKMVGFSSRYVLFFNLWTQYGLTDLIKLK